MPSRRSTSINLIEKLNEISHLAVKQTAMDVPDADSLINLIITVFRYHLIISELPERKVQALITKFRDAGRRSAPWRPTSSRVPGRPQDGADGNRINRWLLPPDHKFYADQISAIHVEIKYFLQTLSMDGAPPLPANTIQNSFGWLLEHKVEPGAYLDPIQLIPISFHKFLLNPTYVQSGHLVPLDRGGRHIPSNTFLMLARSNQIQGNQTLDELITLMNEIVQRHENNKRKTTMSRTILKDD
jgi:hypothetical protein